MSIQTLKYLFKIFLKEINVKSWDFKKVLSQSSQNFDDKIEKLLQEPFFQYFSLLIFKVNNFYKFSKSKKSKDGQ